MSVFQAGGTAAPHVSMNKANLSVAGAARADGGGRRASRSQPAPLPSLGSGTLGPGIRLTTYGFSFSISYPARDDRGPPAWYTQLAGRREGSLGRHLLGRKSTIRGAGRGEAPCRFKARWTSSHLASHAARVRRLPHTLVPQLQPECMHPGRCAGADTRACTLADTCGHVHTQLHARHEKSSETERRCSRALKDAVRADRPLPPPRPNRTFTHIHTCPTQKNPPKGRGDGQLPQKEAELGNECSTPPEKASQGLRPWLSWARVHRNPKAGQAPRTDQDRHSRDPNTASEWERRGGDAEELRRGPASVGPAPTTDRLRLHQCGAQAL